MPDPPYAIPVTPESQAQSAADLPGWQSVAGGLRLSRIGYLTLFIATIVGIPAFIGAALLGYVSGEQAVALALSIGAGVLYTIPWLTGCIFVFVGYGRCCRVPRASGAKGLVITGFAIIMSGWPLQFPALCCGIPPVQEALHDVVNIEPTHPDHLSTMSGLLWVVAVLMMFTGTLLYFLFLWKVNKHWGNKPAAKNVLMFIAFWLGGAVAMTVMLIAAIIAAVASAESLGREAGPVVGLICMGITLAAALAFMIGLFTWLLRVIGMTRKTVLEGIKGTPSTPFAAGSSPLGPQQ